MFEIVSMHKIGGKQRILTRGQTVSDICSYRPFFFSRSHKFVKSLEGWGTPRGPRRTERSEGGEGPPPKTTEIHVWLIVKLPDDFFNSQQYFRLGTRNYPI